MFKVNDLLYTSIYREYWLVLEVLSDCDLYVVLIINGPLKGKIHNLYALKNATSLISRENKNGHDNWSVHLGSK
jgi:hypothetical protein